MKHTIRIVLAALAVSVITACSTSTPVQPHVVKTGTGKSYVPTGK